jgi:hypothetical protein
MDGLHVKKFLLARKPRALPKPWDERYCLVSWNEVYTTRSRKSDDLSVSAPGKSTHQAKSGRSGLHIVNLHGHSCVGLVLA